MKFREYFISEANKKEKSSIENDINFVIGAELEFIVKSNDNIKTTNDVAKLLSSFSPYKFTFSSDPSIIVSNSDIPIEIQTEPMSWFEFQKAIQKFFEFIQEYGYTNNTCGFHSTINYKNTTYNPVLKKL